MVNYFRALRTIVQSPKAKMNDTRWLETLPQGDYLAAQDVVLAHLEDFLAEDHPLDQAALDALMAIDERCRPNVVALTEQYVQATSLPFEIDDRLWNSVCRYYTILAQAYQRFLNRYLEDPSGLPHDLPQLVLNIMDCRRCLLKWRYFRYQPMEEGGWLRLHQLYRLAEKEGCITLPLWRHRNQGETTIEATYLQVMMLGTLSPSDMLKHEIEMVAGWLADWCGMLSMSDVYEVSHHLFYVNLDEDKGGRRTRKIQPTEYFRYWDTDALVSKIARAHLEMQQGKTPAELTLARGTRLPDCQPLLEYLLAEWSRTGYQRQRRADGRKDVSKASHIVDGLEHVCQHIKNLAYARRKGRAADKLVTGSEQSFSNSVFLQLEGGSTFPGMTAEEWTFVNESKYGYGAVVNAGQNPWLRLGRVVSFYDGQDHQHALVGVVRNIKHLPDDRRYVGIEVLSRRPVQVTLRNLDETSRPRGPAEADIFLAATLTQGGAFPFSALYLPKDEARNTPSTLLVPALEYVAGGMFELRSESYIYRVRLGRVIEQRDDWVCVEARMLEKVAG